MSTEIKSPHNQHVWLYWRFKGWAAEQMNSPMRAFFFYDFARQEKGES